MKPIADLWRERFQSYIKELRRYFKYMFNDHLLFVLIFGGGAAIYYYSEWVKTLSADFPVGIIMGITLGILLTISPISTLLKEPDLVFLLPLETKLGSYFKKAISLSFISQAYLLLLVLAAFMPMYVRVSGNGFHLFFFFLLCALGLKVWNLLIHWMMLKRTDPYALIYDWIIRFIFNALLFYFITVSASFWFIGAVLLIMAAFTIYSWQAEKKKTIHWQLLVEKEQRRMQMFYHAANLFTDVPHLRGRVKRRRWLDPLFATIPYGSEYTYRFLYARTILRTSEFSGLILRLTLISAVLLIFMDNLYFSVAISLLFIYLTGFQLLPMLRKYEMKIWPSLYPIAATQKRSAFLNMLLQILFFQAVLLGISAWIGGGSRQGFLIGGVAIIFAVLFAKIYAPTRIDKMENW